MRRGAMIVIAALAMLQPGMAGAADHVPGEVVVRYEASAATAARAEARSAVDAAIGERLLLPRAQVLELPAGVSVEEAVTALEAQPGVDHAEPNFIREAQLAPNDEAFWGQWALHNTAQRSATIETGEFDADIDALEAWDITTGSPNVTIGITDSGITAHPDVAPNLVPGYDFSAGDADPDDENGHGTAVAGAAGAVGNDGRGIAGVTWHSKLMALRTIDASGAGTSGALASAFAYAGDIGLPIVNASLGSGGSAARSQAELDAIQRAQNTLFITAAGTFGGTGLNLDRPGVNWFPCEYDSPNVMCVTSTDQFDRPTTSRDNHGAAAVDIFAPGAYVLAIDSFGSLGGIASEEYSGYVFTTGTSIATPHVSGAAAQVLAANPGLGPVQVKEILMASADQEPQFAGLVASNGRLNVNHALGSTAEAGVETAVTRGPVKPKKDSTPAFDFTSPTRNPATFECKVDKGAFKKCKSGKELAELDPGRHRFEVRATDVLGVTDETPAVKSFKVKKGAKDLPSRPQSAGDI
jgi:subtilisin family serine protease